MNNSLIAAIAAALALGLAACGDDDEGTTQGSGQNEQATEGPAITEVIDVAKRNKGFAKCKKVEAGAVQQQPGGVESEPDVIQPILCDDGTVGNYFDYDGRDAAEVYNASFDERPYFVAGDIVVTTGEAVLSKTYDAKGALSLPEELKAACGCGEVKTPPKN